MRLAAWFLLAGCPSAGPAEDAAPACEITWYLDADGDGYGDPNTTGVVTCSPDLATGFTADNDDDCDDADASITYGTTCPAAFVADCGGTATQYGIGTTDYLVIGPSSADPSDARCVVLPTAVDALCAMWSPNASPIAFNDAAEFGSAKEHMAGDYNAIWIDAAPVDGAWEWVDTGLSFSELGGFCDNASEPPADPAATHLALIKRKLLGNNAPVTCVGQPDQVWGRYFKEVQTGVDSDGDGLVNSADPDPGMFDGDRDGLGDGHEFDVVGTDPEQHDGFPRRVPSDPPVLAFDTAHAFLTCERSR